MVFIYDLFLNLPSLWTTLFSFVCAFCPLFIVHIVFEFFFQYCLTRKFECFYEGGVNWVRSLLLVLKENTGIWFIQTFNFGICTYSRVLSTLRIHSTLRYDYNSTQSKHMSLTMFSSCKSTKNPNKIRKNYFNKENIIFYQANYLWFTKYFFQPFCKNLYYLIHVHIQIHTYFVL